MTAEKLKQLYTRSSKSMLGWVSVSTFPCILHWDKALSFYQHCMYDCLDQSLTRLHFSEDAAYADSKCNWPIYLFPEKWRERKQISQRWPPWVQRRQSVQESSAWPAPDLQSLLSALTSGRWPDPAKHFKCKVTHEKPQHSHKYLMLHSSSVHLAVGGFIRRLQRHALLVGSSAEKLNNGVFISSCEQNTFSSLYLKTCECIVYKRFCGANILIISSHRSPSWLSVTPRRLWEDRRQEGPWWIRGIPSKHGKH